MMPIRGEPLTPTPPTGLRNTRTARPNIWPQACRSSLNSNTTPDNPRFFPLPHTTLIHSAPTMAPKQRTPGTTGPSETTSTPARPSKPASSGSAQDILQGIWNKYVNKTPSRVKLLDTFMAFLIVVGALQFVYVVLVGNFVCICSYYTLPINPPSSGRGYCAVRDGNGWDFHGELAGKATSLVQNKISVVIETRSAHPHEPIPMVISFHY